MNIRLKWLCDYRINKYIRKENEMKRINIYVYDYASEYYPIMAKFSINKVAYSMVFESVSELNRYMFRFYPAKVKIIDKR